MSSENSAFEFDLASRATEKQDCMSCGNPLATAWMTSDGKAWLCRECTTLNGLGCP